MEKEQKAFLDIRYEREGFHNYMVLKTNWEIAEFEIQMINKQDDLRLLPVRCQDESLYYTVDGLQLLEDRMKQTTFSFLEFHTILESLIWTLNELEKYMLLSDSIVLDSKMLYVDSGKQNLYICYIPGYQGNIQNEFCSFMEFLMNRVNHLDDNLIVLIYGIYHITKEDNYSLAKVEEFLKQKRYLCKESSDLNITHSMEYEQSDTRDCKAQKEYASSLEPVVDNSSKSVISRISKSAIAKNDKSVITENNKDTISKASKNAISKTSKNTIIDNNKSAFAKANKNTITDNYENANAHHSKNAAINKESTITANSRILRYQMGKWKQQRVLYGTISCVMLIISLCLGENVWISGNLSSKNLFYACVIVLTGAIGSLVYSIMKIRSLRKHIFNIENGTFS